MVKGMNLILGTANFNRDYGQRLERDECFLILDRAKELGIKTLATAFDYGTEIADEYGWRDRLHKVSPKKIVWGGISGVTFDDVGPISPNRWIMAPFNPLDYRFKHYIDKWFIARSIFCGGRIQSGDTETTAKLVFGFLHSHNIKYAVFGVESLDELELIVRVAHEK